MSLRTCLSYISLLHATSPETRSSQRILIVEDDVEVRQLNEEWLSTEGYQVDTAPDGEAGWEAVQHHNYDLMVTDNSMPKITGLKLIMRLRSAGMLLPVILASGGLPEKSLNWNEELQVAATLAKPYSRASLLDAVSKVLQASANS